MSNKQKREPTPQELELRESFVELEKKWLAFKEQEKKLQKLLKLGTIVVLDMEVKAIIVDHDNNKEPNDSRCRPKIYDLDPYGSTKIKTIEYRDIRAIVYDNDERFDMKDKYGNYNPA